MFAEQPAVCSPYIVSKQFYEQKENLIETLLARAVPPGGTIGIVSPASPYDSYPDVLRGIAWWESKGYHVKLAEGALARTDWTAGSPEVRARDLMTMFADASVDAILLTHPASAASAGGAGDRPRLPHIQR
jgi:hypothetical protein